MFEIHYQYWKSIIYITLSNYRNVQQQFLGLDQFYMYSIYYQFYLYLQTLGNLGLDREFLSHGVVDPDEILLGLGAQPAKFRLRHPHSMHMRDSRTRKIVVRRHCAKTHPVRIFKAVYGVTREPADCPGFALEPLTRAPPCQGCLTKGRRTEVVCVSRSYETVIHS